MNTAVLPSGWVGRLIDGRFPLVEWLGSTESGEIFRTELPGTQSQRAAIRLVPADAEGAQIQFDEWAQAEGLLHPHLLKIFESGRGRIEDDEYFYVVMELPDETLGQVLPERPLTPQETTEMLGPVLDGLAFLHEAGFVHGHLEPTNILVVGETLKLSSYNVISAGPLRTPYAAGQIYHAPETASGTITSAADIWSLGVTIVEALTQRPPFWDRERGGEPVVPASVPPIFAEMAEKCLKTLPAQRCSLAELRTLVRRSAQAPFSPAKPPSAPAAAAPVAVPVNPVPVKPTSAAAPLRRTEARAETEDLRQPELPFSEVQPSSRPLRTFEDEHDEDRHPLKGRMPLIIGGVVVLLALLVVLLARSHRSQPQASDQGTSSASATAPSGRGHASPAANGPTVKGAVLQRVMPDVPARVSRGIRGKVEVKLRVSVDHTGAVSNVGLESGGRFHYFAKLAEDAARKWTFRPPHMNSHSVPSVWTLTFEFRKGRTDVNPVEVTP